jgi:hypothetical protein
MTWEEEDTVKWAYPRFAIERPYWRKFKGYCVEKGRTIEESIRLLIIRMMKAEKRIPQDVSEEIVTMQRTTTDEKKR